MPTRRRRPLLALLGSALLAAPVAGQWPAHSLFHSPVCRGIRNELLCARAIEGGHTLAGSRAFRRHGDTLTVHLPSGSRVFVDRMWHAQPGQVGPPEVMRTSFLGELGPTGAVLIHQISGEQRRLLWIDADGPERDVPETPLFSPDGARYAMVSDYILHRNLLEIRRSADHVTEFRRVTYQHRFPDARWVDGTTLRVLRAVTAGHPDFPGISQQVELARTDTGWVLGPAAGER